jgi:DNA-binding response OmpR family regulator
MAHLREKLELNPSHPELFLTEPGVGYRLVEGN